MKENIQQSGQEVAIVIYDAPLPPKYFRFSKRFIRSLFTIAPITLVIIFFSVFLWGLGSRSTRTQTIITSSPQKKNTSSIDVNRLRSLEEQVSSLESSNALLTEKLATQPSVVGSEDPYLMNIRKPYGMQNLSVQNRVKVEQFELIQEKDKTSLKFQIVSSNPETRVTGHVLVFLIAESGITAYPTQAAKAMSGGIKYSLGEPFAVSRLRPTNAQFPLRAAGESLKFVIYIFSREGDLLLIKETEAFKVGTKT
jgi:hypothetical protein